jgi:hypothetical protein
MTSFEGWLIERMTVRRWCAAIVVLLVAGVLSSFLCYRLGRAKAADTRTDEMAQDFATKLRSDVADNPVLRAVTEVALSRAMLQSNRVRSVSRLLTVGRALRMFASAHGGNGPATIDELASSGLLDDASDLTSPVSQNRYVYRGFNDTEKATALVAYETGTTETANVLCGDGVVRPIAIGALQKAIASGNLTDDDIH